MVPKVKRKDSLRLSDDRPHKRSKILPARNVNDASTIFESVAEDDGMQNREVPFGNPNFRDFRSVGSMLFVDKTMYIEQLEKVQTHFRYTFLRPRRFGKSAFLGLLCTYYDIHTAGEFHELFGPLYIGQHPTPWRNKHLVLKFDLSSISVSGSIDLMRESFNEKINAVLKVFIEKYEEELAYPDIASVIVTRDASASLNNLLKLVGSSNYTLFVGVDEYDSPANNSVFTGANEELNQATLQRVTQIEQFFKESFFAVLKEGCGTMGDCGAIISKFFVTGVTPAFREGISPLQETDIISGRHELHGICGFTEDEVSVLVQCYLRKDEKDAEPIVDTMRRLYNGYHFANSAGDMNTPGLYNPQLVFHFLRELASHGSVSKPNEATVVHSMHILKYIADIGEFSVDNLIELITSGSVDTEIVSQFGFVELLNFGKKKNLCWSLLLYLGILTRGSNGRLKIPNDVMKTEVLQRIRDFLNVREDIRNLMQPAFDRLTLGDVVCFSELLKTFLQTRATRSVMTSSEAMLQGVVELLLPPRNRVPELRLVMDGSKSKGDGRFGFVDVFIPPRHVSDTTRSLGTAIELKYITLNGLVKGAANNWDQFVDYRNSENMNKNLVAENDDALLDRKYMFWSKEKKKSELMTVRDIVRNAETQLIAYMETIVKGEVMGYHESGVFDERVRVTESGRDRLKGHVIVVVGSHRIICRSTKLMTTNFQYDSVFKT
ncbi:hypothetical protein BC938DRAFT_481471 [Jimgerdemannia flammicorona]|uniref:AAA-ATPase-like domain-containing protein n=1 Tax=Jimgerdemannia flammicorona TaxID=994334 RepID=A0A433QWU6_9FUNG|nr:hypothetical protein BC938DRAFT_481471 [Jimgerdemannia flammicorona]